MKKSAFDQEGYSLAETIVAVSIVSFLLLAGAGAFQSAQELNDWNYHAVTLQKELRKIVSTMSEEIRESSPSSPAPITIGPNTITFEIPTGVSGNQITSWMQIRYGLDPSGNVTRTANNQTSPIGNSVQTMNFVYPVDPLTAPRTVQIRITGNRTTLKRTVTVTVTSQVTLRNP